MTDEQVLFLSDIFPTGYMGAEMCDIKPGRRHRRLGRRAGRASSPSPAPGCSGAERVIAIDRFPYRLRLARERPSAETINYEEVDVLDALNEMTGGRGPDACIDAVGMEAHHGHAAVYAYDRAKQATRLETDRPIALRQAIMRLPQRRDGVGDRRLRRLHRQVPDGLADEPVADHPDRPVPRAAVHAAAAGADPQRRDRPQLRHHATACGWTTPRGGTGSSGTSRTSATRSSSRSEGAGSPVTRPGSPASPAGLRAAAAVDRLVAVHQRAGSASASAAAPRPGPGCRSRRAGGRLHLPGGAVAPGQAALLDHGEQPVPFGRRHPPALQPFVRGKAAASSTSSVTGR